MQATFEKLGGTYKQVGDYLLPDVEVPENPAIGICTIKPPDFHWEIRRFLFIERNDYFSTKDIAICSGVMGSSRNHFPVAL